MLLSASFMTIPGLVKSRVMRDSSVWAVRRLVLSLASMPLVRGSAASETGLQQLCYMGSYHLDRNGLPGACVMVGQYFEE